MKRACASLLLVCFVAGIAHAGTLGRLFFTPAQRQQLDASQGRPPTTGNKPAAALVLNGIVQRADGTRTIWINGEAKIDDGNGQAPDEQLVSAAGNPQPVALKVGQQLAPGQPGGE